jgi:hypothetical protein
MIRVKSQMIRVKNQMIGVRGQMSEVVKNKAAALWKEEDGLGTLELILIIGVIIIIALIFKNEITRLITSLLTKVDTKSNDFFPGK